MKKEQGIEAPEGWGRKVGREQGREGLSYTKEIGGG